MSMRGKSTFRTGFNADRRPSQLPGKVGRQMQTWVRFPEGRRVVAAYGNVIAEG
jgi:Protein of unknown function (DUF3225)